MNYLKWGFKILATIGASLLFTGFGMVWVYRTDMDIYPPDSVITLVRVAGIMILPYLLYTVVMVAKRGEDDETN